MTTHKLSRLRSILNVLIYKNMYACIININVPHEVKYQRAIAKRTSQMMENGQDINIQMRSGTRCSR